MSETVRIRLAGREVEAVEVPINQSAEQWNQYLLEDGTVLRLKPVATAALRVVGVFDEEANPVYVMKSTNVVTVQAPESMRRSPAGGQP